MVQATQARIRLKREAQQEASENRKRERQDREEELDFAIRSNQLVDKAHTRS